MLGMFVRVFPPMLCLYTAWNVLSPIKLAPFWVKSISRVSTAPGSNPHLCFWSCDIVSEVSMSCCVVSSASFFVVEPTTRPSGLTDPCRGVPEPSPTFSRFSFSLRYSSSCTRLESSGRFMVMFSVRSIVTSFSLRLLIADRSSGESSPSPGAEGASFSSSGSAASTTSWASSRSTRLDKFGSFPVTSMSISSVIVSANKLVVLPPSCSFTFSSTSSVSPGTVSSVSVGRGLVVWLMVSPPSEGRGSVVIPVIPPSFSSSSCTRSVRPGRDPVRSPVNVIPTVSSSW
mmetsp:Transcript_3874/g.11172  ORF Transcript_3874/g.11172 Transcript_3874/m.11172 type:complete len:287 (+) Transcript_3874:2598-3458(+)